MNNNNYKKKNRRLKNTNASLKKQYNKLYVMNKELLEYINKLKNDTNLDKEYIIIS